MITIADYVISGIIGFSAIVSVLRGFVREALSLISWAVALYVAVHFSGDLAVVFSPHLSSPSVRAGLAFSILFVFTLFLTALVNYLIAKLIDNTGLTGTDRMLGLLFGCLRGALVVTLMIVFANLTPMHKENWWKHSLLIPHFSGVAKWGVTHLPPELATYLTPKKNKLLNMVPKDLIPTIQMPGLVLPEQPPIGR